MAKDKSLGTPTKDNLSGWAQYAKGNSYQCEKTQAKAKADPGLGDDWEQPQRKEEGRGWTKDSVTDNTYTGKGGSKRD
jgi:hypothetical protein